MCEIIEMLNKISTNQQIIYDKLKEIENKSCSTCPWTADDMSYVQEYVLRANLEVKNHDIKIVNMLESLGATNSISEVDYVEPTAEVSSIVSSGTTNNKKGKKVK